MIKRLQAVGNSSGVIIDRPILDLLKITDDSQLEVTTDGERLIITPLSGKGAARKSKVSKAQAKTLAKHAEAFRKLAK
jgi:antitoxin MazE